MNDNRKSPLSHTPLPLLVELSIGCSCSSPHASYWLARLLKTGFVIFAYLTSDQIILSRDALVSAMSKSPFSICVDGSNDNGVEKMYPILVRIFNPESGIVDSRFLDICSIEGKDSSTAECECN